MDKFSLLRGFGHRNSDHGPADHYMLTGYHPVAGFNPSLTPNNQRPSLGSLVSRKLGPSGAARAASSVPSYVCLPTMPNSGGDLLLRHSSTLVIESDPAAPDFTAPDLAPPLSLRADRLTARKGLLEQVDRFQQSAEAQANQAAGAVGVFAKRRST